MSKRHHILFQTSRLSDPKVLLAISKSI